MSEGARRVFWLRTRRLTLALLAVWVLANFGVCWFARDIDGCRGAGSQTAFWLAAQGALLAYLAIVVVYALAMERLEVGYLEVEPPGSGTPGDAAAESA